MKIPVPELKQKQLDMGQMQQIKIHEGFFIEKDDDIQSENNI